MNIFFFYLIYLYISFMEEEILIEDIPTLTSQTFAGQNSHSGLLWCSREVLGTLSKHFYYSPRDIYFVKAWFEMGGGGHIVPELCFSARPYWGRYLHGPASNRNSHPCQWWSRNPCWHECGARLLGNRFHEPMPVIQSTVLFIIPEKGKDHLFFRSSTANGECWISRSLSLRYT